MKLKFQLVTVVTVHVLCRQMWPMAIALDRAEMGHSIIIESPVGQCWPRQSISTDDGGICIFNQDS